MANFGTILRLLCLSTLVLSQEPHNTAPTFHPANSSSDAINTVDVLSTSTSTISTSMVTASDTINTFGLPSALYPNSSIGVQAASGIDTAPSYSYGVSAQPSAERRTLGLLGSGGGGDSYGGGGGGLLSLLGGSGGEGQEMSGGGRGYGGGGRGYGGNGGGGLMNFLTPLAGAAAATAAAAITGGGGASLLSLPNAHIQPTVQKTFVVNVGPHNPPTLVQGIAHQPGASAGQTVNNQYSGRSRGSYGGGGGGGGYRYAAPSRSSYGPTEYYPSGQQKGGKYPASPSLAQAAGKLGLAFVINLAKQSGVLDNLLIGGPFTFFAPSDEAFTKLPQIFLKRASANPELMKSMLLYHLVPDTITTRHFTNDLLLPTLNTKKVRINLYQLGYKKIATVNGAIITRPDQYIINGVIHVIDRVLFPVANGTILQVMNQPNCQPFDVISTVFAIAGLYDKLDEQGPYTVFLPNTEAFGLVPAEERDKLIQNTTLIKEAFLYHIVPGTYYSQGLSDGQWLETLSTFEVPVQVGMVSDGYSRRFDSVNGAVRIVKADIPAENGVIHIVDRILTPFQTYLPCLDG